MVGALVDVVVVLVPDGFVVVVVDVPVVLVVVVDDDVQIFLPAFTSARAWLFVAVP